MLLWPDKKNWAWPTHKEKQKRSAEEAALSAWCDLIEIPQLPFSRNVRQSVKCPSLRLALPPSPFKLPRNPSPVFDPESELLGLSAYRQGGVPSISRRTTAKEIDFCWH
ncbi:hypothetical protein CT0861_02566 [Colletotrichum tofieldiae]|uniref:Uncharacterized protein n=1 Tax=Colletotrichum tofieldiae TaxID=708197 RepID=A0A166U9U4_9PEZI|nr:hypothetical protein CT0861_02566 [Colletotrichum tofieldiae]